jgi:hypothetical protein
MKTLVASITATIQDRTYCRHEWWPPCQGQSLLLRSWPWGRPGWYEGIYWPLSQLRITLNNLKGCNLVSWEATFLSTSGPSGWPSARPGCAWQWGHPHDQNTLSVILSVCLSILVKIFASSQKKIIWFGLGGFLLVHKGFSIAGRVAYSADVFVKKKQFVYMLSYQWCTAFQ